MKRGFGILFIAVLQILLFIIMTFVLDRHLMFFVYPFITLLSFVVALYIFYDYTKSSTSKLSWLILILTVPVLGFIFYLIFGRGNMSNYKKQVLQESQTLNIVSKNEEVVISQSNIFNQIASYLSLNSNNDNVSTADITIIDDGNEKLRLLLKDLKMAETFIHIEYYILKDGNMWQAIEQVLISKALLGVEIKLLVDWAGALFLSDEKISYMKSKGIDFQFFNKPNFLVFNKSLNYRDHRKIIVIDGKVGYMGGFNIGDEYLNLDSFFGNWQDIHVRLEGSVVSNLQSIFSANWYFETKQNVRRNVSYNYNTNHLHTVNCIVFDDGPYLDSGITKDIYFKLITSAKKSIKIATPYLIPETEILNALIIAAKSGVDIQIIVPGKPDKFLVKLATQSYYSILLKNGIKISEYQNGFMHAKKMIVDDEVVILGTTNLDMRSLNLNFEINLVFSDGDKSIERFMQIYTSELIDSKDILLAQHNKRSLFYKVGGVVMRLFAPLL